MRKNPETIRAYYDRKNAKRNAERATDPVLRESINAEKRAQYASLSPEKKREIYFADPGERAERMRRMKIEDPAKYQALLANKNAKRNADRLARREEINAANRAEWSTLTPEEKKARKGAKHAEYKRRTNLKAKFGLSKESYAELLAEQGNLCMICRSPEYVKTAGVVRNLCVDHCHTSGKVRGLLCTLCNGTIGFSRENISYLEACIEYLKSHALKKDA
jgi:hypothetical protein